MTPITVKDGDFYRGDERLTIGCSFTEADLRKGPPLKVAYPETYKMKHPTTGETQ